MWRVPAARRVYPHIRAEPLCSGQVQALPTRAYRTVVYSSRARRADSKSPSIWIREWQGPAGSIAGVAFLHRASSRFPPSAPPQNILATRIVIAWSSSDLRGSLFLLEACCTGRHSELAKVSTKHGCLQVRIHSASSLLRRHLRDLASSRRFPFAQGPRLSRK